MISYNPKDWFTFIFRFHKSDTFRELLPMIVAISIYSGIVVWLETDILKLGENSHLKNISIMHTTLSFVISMLLVFRINSAYDRWWEGRKQWGALVNNCRNLSLKLNAILKGDNQRKVFFAGMISNYPFVLKNHLRNKVNPAELKANEKFNPADIHLGMHNPNYVASKIFEETNTMLNQGVLTQEQMLFINGELSSFTDICGACERIKNTPIPFSYSIFIKKFIFFYIMSLPLTLTFGLGYYCIPVVAFVFYALTSLELISEEIEDPFGEDDNDLPTDTISKNIRKSVYEIFGLELN